MTDVRLMKPKVFMSKAKDFERIEKPKKTPAAVNAGRLALLDTFMQKRLRTQQS